MKQLFINIGFTTILFAFTLNINYCKKNDTIEPEPVNNNPTVSGEYNNETTGDKLILEVNDMI